MWVFNFVSIAGIRQGQVKKGTHSRLAKPTAFLQKQTKPKKGRKSKRLIFQPGESLARNDVQCIRFCIIYRVDRPLSFLPSFFLSYLRYDWMNIETNLFASLSRVADSAKLMSSSSSPLNWIWLSARRKKERIPSSRPGRHHSLSLRSGPHALLKKTSHGKKKQKRDPISTNPTDVLSTLRCSLMQ